jgi:anti-sigma-K factor RskA
MANANRKITAALISDYAAGRLDAEDVQVMEEAINRDKDVAAAVAAARRVDTRMTSTRGIKARRARPRL